MHNYIIQPIAISADLLPILADFSCGVEMIDNILHSQGLLAELHTESPVAYGVYTDSQLLVGFCIAGIVHHQIDFGEQSFSVDMVDVACLAVRKEFQYQGIGTAMLNVICDKADQLVPDGMFLHVEALDLDDGSYSAVPFYQKYGFVYYSRSGEDAARMFYRLNTDEE